MNVVLKPFYGKIYQKNGIFSSSDKNIFYGLDKFLKKKGITITTADTGDLIEPDYYIFCDVPYPWEIKYWLMLFRNLNKSILFCFESPIVNPFSHFRFVQRLFNKVYSWEDADDKLANVLKFHIPQKDRGLDVREIGFNQKQLLVMVNSFKLSNPLFRLLSRYKTDLYKERINLVNYFDSILNNQFSLYGRGWQRVKYKSYKGTTHNKIQSLRKFKYCLCIENNSAPGYITEKIFDCFKAKCVPIYLGAPNIEKYIPKSCFIDFRDFSKYEDLLAYLGTISSQRYGEYLNCIMEFMSSKETIDTWFEAGFKRTFLKAINRLY